MDTYLDSASLANVLKDMHNLEALSELLIHYRRCTEQEMASHKEAAAKSDYYLEMSKRYSETATESLNAVGDLIESCKMIIAKLKSILD